MCACNASCATHHKHPLAGFALLAMLLTATALLGLPHWQGRAGQGRAGQTTPLHSTGTGTPLWNHTTPVNRYVSLQGGQLRCTCTWLRFAMRRSAVACSAGLSCAQLAMRRSDPSSPTVGIEGSV
jgi:hypothetical protein